MWEFMKYLALRDYETFVHNIAKKLANENILYIKLFQALSLNETSELNKALMNYTDNAPYTENDVNIPFLKKIIHENDLTGDIYNPINSGMISLVYKMKRNIDNKDVVLKVKRNHIERKLNQSMNEVFFFLKLLSFLPIPILNTFDAHKTIKTNIDFIYTQLDFAQEVKNMQQMKENCKHMSYVVVPDVYEEITRKYNDVILMEYLSGKSIENIEPDDYNHYSKLVTKFGFATMLIHGFTHADLHPGNILFIKEGDVDYKLGILDFGIMINIENSFKNACANLLVNIIETPARDSATKLFLLLIEPKEMIAYLTSDEYERIISIFEKFIDEFILKDKNLNQAKFYDVMRNVNSYLKKNNIVKKYGLYLNENAVKLQVAMAMCHGVALHLSKDKYIDIANEALNEMFHMDIFSE
jgi:predicted unusual protein kinase regulating ubiquinone biosynthesis (AarF/ABC1/UbiB family)